MVGMGRPVIAVSAVIAISAMIAAVSRVLRHVRVLSAPMGCDRRIDDRGGAVEYRMRQQI